jgi:hypothetical protein
LATTIAQQEQEQEESFDDFESILDYVTALVSAFPTPLSHQELAARVGVTPASVSKMKKRLYQFCNHEVYGLRRQFILSDSMDTAFLLLIQFGFRNKLGVLVRSEYFRSVLSKSGIHEKIVAKSKTYGDYFTKDDTAFIISVILANLNSMEDVTWNFIEEKDSEERQYALFADIMRNFSPLFSGLRLDLKSEEDLIHLLTLRDKLYFLAMKLISEWARNSEASRLLKNKPDELQANVKGFLYFVRHYADRGMKEVNKTIRSWVEPSLHYPSEYDEIGRFFKPSS